MTVANNVVRQVWFYRDSSGNPLTGMLINTDVALVLKSSGAGATVTATEPVSWNERGAGYYDVEYSPTGGGLYTLFLKELNANSDGREWWFVTEVAAAGSVYAPAYANSYCAETDVERFTQLAFTGTSKPTSTEVAGFAQARASEMSVTLLSMAGWTITPATVVSGSLEQDVLRDINAIGAGADAMMSKFMDTDPARTEKAKLMLDEYQTRLQRMVDYAVRVLGRIGMRTPMTSGELTPKDETAITDGGLDLGVAMDQEW